MTTHRVDSWVEALGDKPRAEFTNTEEAWLGFGNDLDAEQRAASSAAAMVAKTCAVRPFPATASRVIELTAGTTKHVREVVRVIETDPTLATRILRYVNSAACGLKVRCKSLYHAVTLLGPRRIRELVTSTAVLSMFERGDALSTSILEHAAVTGALARVIGERFGLASEEMLTCGLLHDLGKLMMLDAEPGYGALLDVAGDDETLCTLEREQYGFDHAVLAGQMLIKWRIPAPVPRVVSWHHQPGRAHHMGGRVALMVEVLRLADAIAEWMSATIATDAQSRAEMIARAANTTSAAYLNMGLEELQRIWSLLSRAHRESRALFHGDEVPLHELEPLDMPKRERAVREAETPVDLSCGLCNELSYGKLCPTCRRPVCEAHDPGLAFCVACEEEFASRTDSMSSVLLAVLLTSTAAAGMMIVFDAYFDVDLAVPVGASFGLAIASGISAAFRRWQRRREFVPETIHEREEAATPRVPTAVIKGDYFEAPLVAAATPDPDGKRLFDRHDLGALVPPKQMVDEGFETDIDSPDYTFADANKMSSSSLKETLAPAVPIFRQVRARATSDANDRFAADALSASARSPENRRGPKMRVG